MSIYFEDDPIDNDEDAEEEHQYDDGDDDCPVCYGTGEGVADGTSCTACRGTGVVGGVLR